MAAHALSLMQWNSELPSVLGSHNHFGFEILHSAPGVSVSVGILDIKMHMR
jgi:hypothetical protein